MEASGRDAGCAFVLGRLDDFLDQQSSDDEARAVLDHLSRCGDCAARYQRAYLALAQLRQAVQSVTAPDDLMGRIARHLSLA
jgi:hypothetical protein